MAAGALVSIGILAVALPVSALLAQRGQISATAAELAHLRQQNQALNVEHHQLTDTAEVGRLAREQYQLVTPGQSLFTILPANDSGVTPAAATDPGLLPPVAPADAPGMAPDPGLPAPSPAASATSSSTATAAPGPGGNSVGFWGRVKDTLEFWR